MPIEHFGPYSKTLKELKQLLKDKEIRPANINNTQRFPGGLIASSVEKEVIESWNNFPDRFGGAWWGCYSAAVSRIKNRTKSNKNDWDYYVGFPGMPFWFEKKLVPEVNNFFDHIEMTVLKNKPMYAKFYREERVDNYRSGNPIYRVWFRDTTENEKEKHVEFCFPVVKFNYSKEYSYRVRCYFTLVITILFRMLCQGEGYANPFYYPRYNTIKYLCEINNDGGSYRSLSKHRINPERLARLNDVDQTNKNAEPMYSNYGQTDIFRQLTSRPKKETA